jgi:hypothetical protein
MPADLTNPFGPSCCDGGESTSTCTNIHQSAQPCGCDPGMNWFCANHKLSGQLRDLIIQYRLYAEETEDTSAAMVFNTVAQDLENLL